MQDQLSQPSFFRLIYLNYLVVENEAKLKKVFTFGGVALSCLLAGAHLMEYTVRNDSPELLFHYHYCAKVWKHCQKTLLCTSLCTGWSRW